MYLMDVNVETDKEKAIEFELLNPHYTDRRFVNHSHTVFLARGYHATNHQFGIAWVPGVEYNYSDRLEQWYGFNAHQAAWVVASSQGFAKNSAASIEAYLRELLEDRGLKLVHIIAGVNLANGHPHQIFGFTRSKSKGE